jgi:hypothetical protein
LNLKSGSEEKSKNLKLDKLSAPLPSAIMTLHFVCLLLGLSSTGTVKNIRLIYSFTGERRPIMPL